MIAPFNWLNLGLTARNINSPSFDAAGVGKNSDLPESIQKMEEDLTLDAQVRAGLALMPLKNLVLAMDVDLTENNGVNLPEFKSRLISFGAEYVVPFTDGVDLVLRGGTYNNISGGSNDNWAITFGFGLRLWNFIIDASGGLSTELENFKSTAKGKEIPNRLVAGIGFKYEKRF